MVEKFGSHGRKQFNQLKTLGYLKDKNTSKGNMLR